MKKVVLACASVILIIAVVEIFSSCDGSKKSTDLANKASVDSAVSTEGIAPDGDRAPDGEGLQYIECVGYNRTGAIMLYYYRDSYTQNMYMGTSKSGLQCLYDANGKPMKFKEFIKASEVYEVSLY